MEPMHKSACTAGAAIILLATLSAYMPAIQGGFVWDDDVYVTNNATLRTVEGLRHIWLEPGATPQYYPLVFSTFWLEYRLWGLQPLGYHIVNVLLHVLAALLLWCVLHQLSLPGAWLAAAIFALHPVHVESVAWITERKNVLSGLFYLAATLAYFRFSPPGRESSIGRRAWGFYACAFAVYLCALLSKTATCSWPVAMLLVLWWKRDPLQKRDIVPLLPLFVIGLAMGVTTVWVERNLVGAEGVEWSLNMVERCFIAGRAVWFYLGKLIYPVSLSFIYPRWSMDTTQLSASMYLVAIVILLLVLRVLRHRIGKGPLVAALFFVGTLGPALGFFPVYFMRYTFVADHFQYLASIGPIALAATLLTRAWRWPDRPASIRIKRVRPWVGGSLSVVLLMVLAAATWQRSGVYTNAETLWRDTLAKNPLAWMAHNNLGQMLWQQGKYEDAERHFAEYVKLRPGDPEAHNHLANALARRRNLEGAAFHYQEAIRLKPDQAQPYLNLGTVRDLQGQPAEAAEHYSAALRLAPEYAQARRNLARLLYRVAAAHLQAGRREQALTAATQARDLAGGIHDPAFARRVDAIIQYCQSRQSSRPVPATLPAPATSPSS